MRFWFRWLTVPSPDQRQGSPWNDPEHHARRIRVVRIGERYSLLDVAPDRIDNPEGGFIAGWVYPLPESTATR